MLVAAAYATWRLNWMDWHAYAGYALLALVHNDRVCAKSSKVAKCPEPRLPWELEIANSLVTK